MSTPVVPTVNAMLAAALAPLLPGLLLLGGVGLAIGVTMFGLVKGWKSVKVVPLARLRTTQVTKLR